MKFLQREGFDVSAGFIVGFYNDSPSVFDRQIAFIQESRFVAAMVGLLTAETGTRLHKGCRRIVRTIYSPKIYYRRALTFLSEYRMPKTGTKAVTGEPPGRC